MAMPKRASATFDFDLLAEDYDRWYETSKGRTYDRLEKRAVARLLPHSSRRRRLLEVGCGTGHWTCFFSEKGFRIAAVDISPAMLGIARGKDISGPSFSIADAHSLPFRDSQFDVAAAIATLEFVRNPEVVVDEMARCLRKPKGVLLVGVLNAWSRRNRRKKSSGQLPYSAVHLFSPREVKTMLAPYGRTEVTVTAFVPSAPWLLPLAPLANVLLRMLHLPYGDFIVGRVEL